ncbi:CdaR family protein [Halobacillus sp. H74]|uniref:CdaR family protein n=1 Tax=Halobacillus sp. H74 TaxID=3457436 RepID=UPI003FCE2DC8
MDNWLKSVWFIRIISLILAGLLWVTVNVDNNMDSDSLFFNETSSDMEVMENIPLEIRFDSEEYVVSGIPQEVSVTVEGPAGAVAPAARQKNFNVFADLNGLGPGTHEVSLQHSGISNQLAVTLEPKMIEVTIEEKVTENFEVNIDYINESSLKDNLELGEPEVRPAEVSITGASSVIERVASVKAIIDVGSATETIEQQEAPVKVYDNQGNELNVLVDPTAVNVTVPVIERTKELSLNVAPQGGAPEGVLVESVTTETEGVTVSGPRDVLEDIEELPEVPVDITDVTEDQTVNVDIPLPEGVTSVSPETIEVQIDVDEPDAEGSSNQETETEQP